MLITEKQIPTNYKMKLRIQSNTSHLDIDLVQN